MEYSLCNNLCPDEAVYFVDAVHPEHQSKPSFGWMKRNEKLALKSNSRRQRLNIHGALDLETGDFRFVEDTDTPSRQRPLSSRKTVETMAGAA